MSLFTKLQIKIGKSLTNLFNTFKIKQNHFLVDCVTGEIFSTPNCLRQRVSVNFYKELCLNDFFYLRKENDNETA